MPYTPEEYEKLKAAYKEELRQRKAILEAARQAYLRQKAEWHLAQMQSALEALGYSLESPRAPSEPTPSPQEVKEPSSTSSLEPPSPPETKTLF